MSRKFSYLISWCSLMAIAVIVALLFSLLINIPWLAELAQSNLQLPIHWATVQDWQWYLLWVVTAAHLSIGIFGLYFLHLAFRKIAAGELFNLSNSLNMRRFAILLVIQALTKPIHLSITSVILSLNHPKGEKVLSILFGSQELTMIVLAMIFWVVSDVLVAGSRLQFENRQFV